MPSVATEIYQVTTRVDATTTRLEAEVADLKTLLDGLKGRAAEAKADAHELEAIDAIEAKIDVLDIAPKQAKHEHKADHAAATTSHAKHGGK